MNRLITDDWLVRWPTDCQPSFDRVFSLPRLRAAAVMWITCGVPNVERVWCICVQHRAETYIEQRGYATRGDHNPIWYTPNFVQEIDRQHRFHLSLSLPGSLGLDCVRELRSAGAWRMRGNPVAFEELLDGIWFFLEAWHPKWGVCSVMGSSGAVYRGRVSSSRAESAIWRWCSGSPELFRRAARWQQWLGWLPLPGLWTYLWR